MLIDHKKRTGEIVKRIDASHVPVAAGVYAIKSTITGDCYVGGTEVLRLRCNQHALQLLAGKNSCKAMQASYDKHGPEAFEIVVLAVCTPKQVTAHELGWFKKLKPNWNGCPPRFVHRNGGSLDYHRWHERRRIRLERESDLIAAK